MTNPNNTTAACSGGELADALQSGELTLVWCHPRGLGAADATASQIALVETAIRDQASAPRSASAGGAEGARLSNWLADYTRDLKEDGFEQEAAEIEKASQWIADHLAPFASAAAFLSAPRPIRIDQDAGIRARLIAAGCTSPDGSYVHASTESVLAAISANTTAVREAPESCPHCFDRTDCSNVDICKAVEEVYREPTNTTAVVVPHTSAGTIDNLLSRLDQGAAYQGYPEGFGFSWTKLAGDAATIIRRLLASNPLEGKGIQSHTEQASSGLRSTNQREG